MSQQQCLAIEQGKDYVNVDEADLPYDHVEVLGQGGTGFVEKVKDRMTGKTYARKTIPIVKYRKKEDRETVFKTELKTIRGLEGHHHIIKIFATYVTSRKFGLILLPVASHGDLSNYLDNFWKIVDESALSHRDPRLNTMRLVLSRAFGCLAAGLAFMHVQKVRHKDVKPGNILIHDGSVIYTDFGYSLDFSGFDRSTTEGVPNCISRKYSSPELSMHEPRNSKSDVFSLGCVFIEILSALTLNQGLATTSNMAFSAMLDHVHEELHSIDVGVCPTELSRAIVGMTKREPSERLCSIHAAEAILRMAGLCCSTCRESPIQTWRESVNGDNCS
ncbi:kinase-like domain-containing protein [Paraphoma chrysanthemicola]|nr:kinase-like domain-containing protein [Paraphoma chrysanthemicola]